MTTKRDWLFRADYMRLKAKHLGDRSTALDLEAYHYRCRAESAQTIADSMPDDPPIIIPPSNPQR